MPFIHSFGGAMKLLHSIEIGTCTGSCRSSWIRNFKYALKTETNPLKLTPTQRKQLECFHYKSGQFIVLFFVVFE
jgi:hypothetical protein